MQFKHTCLALAAVLAATSSSSVFAIDVEQSEPAVEHEAVAAEEQIQQGLGNSSQIDGDSNSGVEDGGSRKAGFSMGDKSFRFPAWPDKKPAAVKDVPPPPPLGPYMSSALNAEQGQQPKFGSIMSMPVPAIDDTPMTAFSPDLPWPGDNRQQANRWLPEDGYQFVAPGFSAPLVNRPFVNRAGDAAGGHPQSNTRAYRLPLPVRPQMPVRTSMMPPQSRMQPGGFRPVNNPGYSSPRPSPAPGVEQTGMMPANQMQRTARHPYPGRAGEPGQYRLPTNGTMRQPRMQNMGQGKNYQGQNYNNVPATRSVPYQLPPSVRYSRSNEPG